jgi:hypothetical protein
VPLAPPPAAEEPLETLYGRVFVTPRAVRASDDEEGCEPLAESLEAVSPDGPSLEELREVMRIGKVFTARALTRARKEEEKYWERLRGERTQRAGHFSIHA